MKIAKADKEDFEFCRDFIHSCENIWDKNYSLISDEDTWEKWWDENDEDYLKMKKIKKRISKELDIDEDEVDNRIVVYEWLRSKFKIGGGSFLRVMIAADVLIDNVCDPTDDCLSFHPCYEISHVTPEQ